MTKKMFLWNTALSLIGFAVLTVANFLYSVMTVRILSPEDFAAYNTFFYFMLALPLPSFQLAIAKVVSQGNSESRKSLFLILPALQKLAGMAAIAYVVASPLLWFLYGQKDPWIILIGFFILQSWIWLSGLRGICQGSLRFGVYSLNLGVEGTSRLVIGTVAILMGLGAYGALGASVFSGIIGIGVLVVPILLVPRRNSSPLSPEEATEASQGILRTFFTSLLVLLPFGLLVVLDQTMINRFAPSYSPVVNLVSLFGKNLIALSLTIAHVVFPYVVKGEKNGFLIRGIGMVGSLFLLAWLFTLVAHSWLFELLFGSSLGSDFLPIAIVYCLPLGLLQLLVHYSIAKQKQWISAVLWGYLVVAAAGMYALVSIDIISLQGLYAVFSVAHGVLFVVLLLVFLAGNRAVVSEKRSEP